MSGEPSDDELEELRQEKMEQLRDQAEGGGDDEARQAAQEQAEAQRKAVLRQHLTDGARKRLNTVKMSKPDIAEQVEQQIVALAQSGRLGGEQIDEDQMRDLLKQLTPDSKSFNIRHR
ncbi:DNA-binding protein [Halapricum desulfuricans]|uniref:DNA-binding protein HSBGL_1835 n=1 Tax=Halapricum desulfuricans TaxID=2841257 RepID=A0A897NG62_9EURY|nr:DNA-binding protein [Halapricum desulfuricans]QSG09336.1 DNA-binding TFAR19-related protein, PDSD5 family [Halapricum desulfuricans]QSG12246.1 DNA-binding TFAR19-related protein, PDSD5 family [Halapricum desulfuricans]